MPVPRFQCVTEQGFYVRKPKRGERYSMATRTANRGLSFRTRRSPIDSLLVDHGDDSGGRHSDR
jgi:hypothetical protein